MAADQEYIPAELPEDLPEPQNVELFENGKGLHSFGKAIGGPLVMVHTSGPEYKAVLFPDGVTNEDAPASHEPIILIDPEGSQKDKTRRAAYAAKVALEKSND
ncbi:MAG: hypothetical protein U0524_02485 [Candidatus Saccharimonadales bacterium]